MEEQNKNPEKKENEVQTSQENTPMQTEHSYGLHFQDTNNPESETTLYHMREVTRIYGRLAKASEEKETDEIANTEEEERQDNDQNSKIVE